MKTQNKHNQPLVSIIMPVYNAGGFLVPAITSILEQTYSNFELIIVNDHSTDNSLETILKFKKQFPHKIKVLDLKHTLNHGGDSCANEGLKIAKGAFIARMDADDIAHPDRLTKQVAYMLAHPKTFLVGTNAYVIDKQGKVIGDKTVPLTSPDIYHAYFTFHPLIHPSTLYRRIYKGKQFLYKLKYSANNDYYTFFKMICQGAIFANLPEKLMYYRIHGKNDTFVNMKKKFGNTLRIRIKMVLKYGYHANASQILTTALQGLALWLLPESITTKLYLLAKGIIKIQNPFPSILPLQFKTAFRVK